MILQEVISWCSIMDEELPAFPEGPQSVMCNTEGIFFGCDRLLVRKMMFAPFQFYHIQECQEIFHKTNMELISINETYHRGFWLKTFETEQFIIVSKFNNITICFSFFIKFCWKWNYKWVHGRCYYRRWEDSGNYRWYGQI